MPQVSDKAETRRPSWSSVPLFYKCSYDTWTLLRFLRKYHYHNLKWKADHDRWSRKDPVNRIRKHYKTVDGLKKRLPDAPWPEPWFSTVAEKVTIRATWSQPARFIFEDVWQDCRTPKKQPVKPLEEAVEAEIETLASKLFQELLSADKLCDHNLESLLADRAMVAVFFGRVAMPLFRSPTSPCLPG